MNRFLNLFLLGLLPIGISCQSREDRRANLIGHRYIATEKYGVMLPTVTQVDLFAFGESSASQGKEFRLAYAPDTFAVTNGVTLRGEAAARFGDIWRKQRFTWAGTMCFEPAFGMRFSNENGLVFETAVCLHCTGFTVPVKGRSTVVGFSGGHTNFLTFSNALARSFTSP